MHWMINLGLVNNSVHTGGPILPSPAGPLSPGKPGSPLDPGWPWIEKKS